MSTTASRLLLLAAPLLLLAAEARAEGDPRTEGLVYGVTRLADDHQEPVLMSPSGRFVAWIEPPAVRLHDTWTGETRALPGPALPAREVQHPGDADPLLSDRYVVWRRYTGETFETTELYLYDLRDEELRQVHAPSGVNDNPILLDDWLVWRGLVELAPDEVITRVLAYRLRDGHFADLGPDADGVSQVAAAGSRIAWKGDVQPIPGGVGPTAVYTHDLRTGETELLQAGESYVGGPFLAGDTIRWNRLPGGFGEENELHVASLRARRCGRGAELAWVVPPLVFLGRRTARRRRA